MDHLLPLALKEYILQTSSKEPLLLEQLRQETKHEFGSEMYCGPIIGMLLSLLVKLSGAKTCLELGTFTGYSALHIASGLPVDGKLITCEVNPSHASMAQRYFDKSPHGHQIEILLGEAQNTIQTLHQTFDFIFIDADKANYPLYYDLLIPKLNPKGLMLVDNALWEGEVVAPSNQRAQAIHALNQKACQDSDVQTLMLAIRDGLLLIYKT
ncbi:MAG: O-methyltransferase [Candidatus Berkiella sp.]